MKQPVSLHSHRPKVAVYSLDHEDWACPAIRILAPMQYINWDVAWAAKQDPSGFIFDLEVARKADLIIIQRHFPAPTTENVLRSIVNLKVPIVYDLDDAFLDVPQTNPHYNLLRTRVPYIKWILKEADLITVSTKALQESIKKHTTRSIVVQPNLVDWDLFDVPPRARSSQFNFLISGTTTHQGDWSIIEEPLAEILKIHKKVVNATFFGEMPQKFSKHPSARLVNFQANYKSYARSLKVLDIHAALIPLEDTKFNRCKSNIKWLEYSAAGIAGIFSDITPYNSSVRNGETGLLVENSADSWFHGMKTLLDAPDAAHAMAEKARDVVHEHYSIQALSDAYSAVFNDLIGRKHVQNPFSELPIFSTQLHSNAHRFLDRHILWRFKHKH
jgi:glycosyltransferase involved in cell wall biosynthesis